MSETKGPIKALASLPSGSDLVVTVGNSEDSSTGDERGQEQRKVHRDIDLGVAKTHNRHGKNKNQVRRRAPTQLIIHFNEMMINFQAMAVNPEDETITRPVNIMKKPNAPVGSIFMPGLPEDPKARGDQPVAYFVFCDSPTEPYEPWAIDDPDIFPKLCVVREKPTGGSTWIPASVGIMPQHLIPLGQKIFQHARTSFFEASTILTDMQYFAWASAKIDEEKHGFRFQKEMNNPVALVHFDGTIVGEVVLDTYSETQTIAQWAPNASHSLPSGTTNMQLLCSKVVAEALKTSS